MSLYLFLPEFLHHFGNVCNHAFRVFETCKVPSIVLDCASQINMKAAMMYHSFTLSLYHTRFPVRSTARLLLGAVSKYMLVYPNGHLIKFSCAVQ